LRHSEKAHWAAILLKQVEAHQDLMRIPPRPLAQILMTAAGIVDPAVLQNPPNFAQGKALMGSGPDLAGLAEKLKASMTGPRNGPDEEE
jgi:hypothetical protein